MFTTLTKRALPLLRYNTHDISSITHERCACGRTLTRMARITGRSDDMLIIRGVNVFPSQIESVLLSVGQVEPYYMILVDRVNNLDVMEIKVELFGGRVLRPRARHRGAGSEDPRVDRIDAGHLGQGHVRRAVVAAAQRGQGQARDRQPHAALTGAG